jgi:hypothetical protein
VLEFAIKVGVPLGSAYRNSARDWLYRSVGFGRGDLDAGCLPRVPLPCLLLKGLTEVPAQPLFQLNDHFTWLANVTGHFKTSQWGSLENQPVVRVIF